MTGGDVTRISQTSSGSTEIPDELALRQIPKLDENDPAALVDFMNRWGALTPFWGDTYGLLPPLRPLRVDW